MTNKWNNRKKKMTENHEEIKKIVDHPDYYNSHPSGIEAIEIVRYMDFNTGSAVKYMWRLGHKDSELKELEKVMWYITDEIETYENLGFFRKIIKTIVKQFSPNKKRNMSSICGGMIDHDVAQSIICICAYELSFGAKALDFLEYGKKYAQKAINLRINKKSEELNGTI